MEFTEYSNPMGLSHSRYHIGLSAWYLWDLTLYYLSAWCQTLLFSCMSKPCTLSSAGILSYCKLIIRKLMHAAFRSVFRLREVKTKCWNHSLSLMMSTQRQWGAALISVTCPCASHQLHYGSISHASSANWIACEVVTRTGARAASVPLLLHKWEWSFPVRHYWGS